MIVANAWPLDDLVRVLFELVDACREGVQELVDLGLVGLGRDQLLELVDLLAEPGTMTVRTSSSTFSPSVPANAWPASSISASPGGADLVGGRDELRPCSTALVVPIVAVVVAAAGKSHEGGDESGDQGDQQQSGEASSHGE